VEFEFRALGLWPGPMTKWRKPAKFRAGYTDTLRLLDRELTKLGARQVVLQLALRPEEIRLDGRPKANARPSHPGVILSFESRHGPLSYPCDTYDSWEDNLRAVALSLEHLRAVDRYGVTKRGEQYRGWSQLPNYTAPMTAEEALAVLAKYGERPKGREELGAVYRAAVLATHPDRGGDTRQFAAVQRAKEVLEKVL
jgi:hypothetical protein